MALNLKRPVRPTSFPLQRPKLGNVMIAIGFTHTVGLKKDGTCVAVGDNSQGQCNVSEWTNIVKVVNAKSRPGYGYAFTVGLKADGTVVTTRAARASEVANWKDIVDIGAGYDFIFGLKSDGTCVLSEGNTWGHSVSAVQNDKNIIAINGLALNGLTLSMDGTIHHAGWSGNQTINSNNAIKASLNNYNPVYLTADGKMIESGQEKYSDIVDFDCWIDLIGLKSDGTCVATGNQDVSDWKDIISVSNGRDNYAGVRSDGTCIAKGDNTYGQCNVSDWNLYGHNGHKKALMISLAGLNFTNYNAVNSISVDGIEPENTKRRLAFKVGDTWNKLAVNSGAATLSALPTQTLTANSVLNEGNTVAEVASATSIPDFAGKIVYPAIALYADKSAAVMPTIGLKANATTDRNKNSIASPVYHISDTEITITDITVNKKIVGNAGISIFASIKNSNGWSFYTDIDNIINKKATDIKFIYTFYVKECNGENSAHLIDIAINYDHQTMTLAGTFKISPLILCINEKKNGLIHYKFNYVERDNNSTNSVRRCFAKSLYELNGLVFSRYIRK